MSDWMEDIARATATAQQTEAAEGVAEERFDAAHARAAAAGDVTQALSSHEFTDWMAARNATDTAWGAWSGVMDSKPDGH